MLAAQHLDHVRPGGRGRRDQAGDETDQQGRSDPDADATGRQGDIRRQRQRIQDQVAGVDFEQDRQRGTAIAAASSTSRTDSTLSAAMPAPIPLTYSESPRLFTALRTRTASVQRLHNWSSWRRRYQALAC